MTNKSINLYNEKLKKFLELEEESKSSQYWDLDIQKHDRILYQFYLDEINSALSIQEWLINHKILCTNPECLCNSSTPVDTLVGLYERTANDDIAECLQLSNGKIKEVRVSLGMNQT